MVTTKKAVTQVHRECIKGNKEEIERPLNTVIHLNKDKMKMPNSMIDCSSPSKIQLFCSLHIVHTIQ